MISFSIVDTWKPSGLTWELQIQLDPGSRALTNVVVATDKFCCLQQAGGCNIEVWLQQTFDICVF